MVQLPDGQVTFARKMAGEPPMFKYWLTRATIVAHLREQCEAAYGDLVTFEDGYSLVGGNLAAGAAPCVYHRAPAASKQQHVGCFKLLTARYRDIGFSNSFGFDSDWQGDERCCSK